jgi:hypothetical protein
VTVTVRIPLLPDLIKTTPPPASSSPTATATSTDVVRGCRVLCRRTRHPRSLSTRVAAPTCHPHQVWYIPLSVPMANASIRFADQVVALTGEMTVPPRLSQPLQWAPSQAWCRTALSVPTAPVRSELSSRPAGSV